MNAQLFATLVNAIDETLDKHCEHNLWTGLIHPLLAEQMAKAAALVFDAGMDSQEFAERENL